MRERSGEVASNGVGYEEGFWGVVQLWRDLEGVIGQAVVERRLRLRKQRDVGDGKGVVGAQWR